MKKQTLNPLNAIKKIRAVSFFIVASLFFAPGAFGTAMSGTYSVCGSSCGFSTINAALSALKSNGVSGPVIISIASGKWSETLSITSAISGISSTNTVTFQGAGMYSTVITSTSTILSITNSTYINFQSLGLYMSGSSSGYGVSLGTGANYINFIKCDIKTSGGSSSYVYGLEPVYISSAKYCTFDSCSIHGSGYACVQNSSSTGITFEYCRLTNFYYFGFYNSSTNNAVYNGNYIDSGGNYGFYSVNENGTNIESNTIPCTSSSLFYYGIFLDYPNSGSQSSPFIIVNNIIGPNFYEAGIYLYTSSISNAWVDIYHNTINGNTLAATYYYFSDLIVYQTSLSASGYYIRNNELSLAGGSGYCLSLYLGASGITGENGNNLYNPGGDLVYFNGTSYSSLAAYQAAASSSGLATHDMNMQPVFVSSTDFHYSQTVLEPYGPYCGIDYDIDGDARCKIFPSAGADESNFLKGKANATIDTPMAVYLNSPAVFTDSGNVPGPDIYAWYNGNKPVGDSFAYATNTLANNDTLSFVVTGCGGKDSQSIIVHVKTPKMVPVADFLCNANTIEQYDTVKFTDLSTNGPTSWLWSVSPSTYSYTYGDSASQNPQIKFNSPGVYTICLASFNSVGKSLKTCKTSYITVIQSLNMCSTSQTHEGQGYLYDDGGPNGNIGTNLNCSLIIQPCSDTLYFVFDQFNLDCSNAYLKLLNGSSGSTLNSKHSPAQGSLGFTGSGTTYCATSDIPAIGDTFISTTGQIYLNETTSNPNSPGFRAHWWSTFKKYPKPVAKLTNTPDSLCVNQDIFFYADTDVAFAGKYPTYLWDIGNGFSPGGSKINVKYTTTGTYSVRLIVNNCGGTDTDKITLKIYTPSKPVANFSADNINPTTGDIVYFTPSQMMCVDTFRWTFTRPGGASFSYQNGTSSYSEYPQVTFNDTGCWTVQLYEENNGGRDSLLKSCYIFVKKPYCTPTVSNTNLDIGLSYVSLNTISNITGANRLGYHNFIPTDSTTLDIGLKYTLSLKRVSNYNTVDVAAWIDWNGDAVFSPSELVYSNSNSIAKSWDTIIKVPKNAYKGATVLRVAINKGGLGDKVCGQDAYGDYEDYRIYITPFNIPPVINLYGPDTVYVYLGGTYAEPGYIAIDSVYGNITFDVIEKYNKTISTKKPDTFYAYYNVTDSAGLSAKTVTRVIIVKKYSFPPVIGLCGNDTVNVAVDSPYKDKGVCSAYSGLYGNLINRVAKSGKINTNIVGTDTISYTVCDSSGNCTTANRFVNIIDTIAPEITITGPDTITVQAGEPYKHDIIKIKDNYYINLTATASGYVDTTTPGIYVYTYNATDGSGNSAKPVTIVFNVIDTIPPTVTIKGSSTIYIEVYNTYTDAGATVSDYLDVNPKLKTGGTYFINFPTGYAKYLGHYAIIYTGTNAYGDTTIATRTVIVEDTIKPIINLLGAPTANVCRWKPYVDDGYNVTDNYSPLNKINVTEFNNVNVDSNGTYSVYYVAADSVGNIDTSIKRIVFVTDQGNCSSGIPSLTDFSNSVSIYPNPGDGVFTIDLTLPAIEQATITVTDIMGQVIKQISCEMGSQKQMLNITGAANGIYFVNINAGGQSVTRKLMVQN